MTYVVRNVPEGVDSSKSEECEDLENNSASFFALVSPKNAFIMGLITGLLTVCSIGFILLLTLFLKG